jgi:hypothetical protein
MRTGTVPDDPLAEPPPPLLARRRTAASTAPTSAVTIPRTITSVLLDRFEAVM